MLTCFLSVRDVAQMLNLSHRTVQRMFHRKELDGVQYRGVLRITASSVEKYLHARGAMASNETLF